MAIKKKREVLPQLAPLLLPLPEAGVAAGAGLGRGAGRQTLGVGCKSLNLSSTILLYLDCSVTKLKVVARWKKRKEKKQN